MRSVEIARLLPGVFRETLPQSPLLAALLEGMCSLLDPVDRKLGLLERFVEPRRAPDADVDPTPFVEWLAGWVDLDAAVAAWSPNVRELVASAWLLARWRGTSRGLRMILELATGVRGFEIEEGAGPFHLRVHLPAGALAARPMIHRIMRREKPAYATYELVAPVQG